MKSEIIKTITSESTSMIKTVGGLVAMNEAKKISRRALKAILSSCGVSAEWLASKKGKIAITLIIEISTLVAIYLIPMGKNKKEALGEMAKISIASKLETILGEKMSMIFAAGMALRAMTISEIGEGETPAPAPKPLNPDH